MKLLNLPAELLLRIVHHTPSISDKIQLLQTCTRLNHLLCTHVACWDHLDLSPYTNINNSTLLTFLKNTNIYLYTSSIANNNTINHGVSRLDLSGCWCLSQDMVVALSKSFSSLDELFLNGYQLNNTIRKSNMGFEQQRVHVYQVRPAHDLSSMTMDLSKKAMDRLDIPYVLLSAILHQVPHINSLSIQYQDLAPNITTHRPYFSEFTHIQHLDISSCIVKQGSLQSMLRKIGNQLKSLKMLNIDLNNMSWLCLGQYGKNIQCLHVSCNEPMYLPFIRHTVSNFKYLDDFRLTRIRTGTIDPIIEKLNWNILRVLDLSPKMNIYPKAYNSNGGGGRSRKHPPQPILSMSNYATTEHDLLVSDASLFQLSRCHNLTELRLCFPTISQVWLYRLFKSIPQLEIFELRLKQEEGKDYLKGIKYLTNLKEAYLYSVYISQSCINTLAGLHQTRHITISRGGNIIEDKDNQCLLLNECCMLEILNIGQLNESISSKSTWSTTLDIMNNIKEDSCNISFYKKDRLWCVI